MMSKSFTFIVVSSDRGQLRRVKVPFYALYFLALFALVGGVTVLAATGSYTRMLWKATSYNALRRDQEDLKRQYMHLQVMAKDSDQKLTSLQSLATTGLASKRRMRSKHRITQILLRCMF